MIEEPSDCLKSVKEIPIIIFFLFFFCHIIPKTVNELQLSRIQAAETPKETPDFQLDDAEKGPSIRICRRLLEMRNLEKNSLIQCLQQHTSASDSQLCICEKDAEKYIGPFRSYLFQLLPKIVDYLMSVTHVGQTQSSIAKALKHNCCWNYY